MPTHLLQISEAVMDIFTAKCPEIVNDARQTDIAVALDFESSKYDNLEAFCGRRSVRNPYQVGLGTNVLVSYYKYVSASNC